MLAADLPAPVLLQIREFGLRFCSLILVLLLSCRLLSVGLHVVGVAAKIG